jgi:hypothetical protein
MGMLLWEQVRPERRGRRTPLLRLEEGERPPLGIIVADQAGTRLRGAVPALRATERCGLWTTPETDEGGLYVIDTSAVDPAEGLAWWAWIGLARTSEEERARLTALLGDPNLPIEDRTRIQEAVMDGQLSATPVEQETASQRVRREGRLESLLELVREVAPERLAQFSAITDVQQLQRAVLKLLKG